MESIESETRKQLRDKIASLTQSQLGRAADALSMIWDSMTGPLDPPAPDLKYAAAKLTQYPESQRLIFPLSSSWPRAKLALLKSISTGIFIDVQLYAYNAICNGLPLDQKPLFISSILIKEWATAITTRKLKFSSSLFRAYRDKETAGIDSQALRPVDELTDDYEYWDGDAPETLGKDKSVLYVRSRSSKMTYSHVSFRKYQTEATAAPEGREALTLTSGAWKTSVVSDVPCTQLLTQF